jgi:hypothetical protein
MINRSITRTILNATETTAQTKTLTSDSLAFEMTTGDVFYLGFKQPFATRYFDFQTPNTNACTLTLEYWNGVAWKTVEDLIDETQGFTKSGFIAWLNPGNWIKIAQAPIKAVDARNVLDTSLWYFWLRIKVSADLSAGTALQSVVNLFCHDDGLRALYPDLVSDTRWLPAGRTDFMEQFAAARDLVVNHLKQAGKITDEGDILDINEVATAAVHATAYVILHPVKGSEEVRLAAKDAYAAMSKQLERSMVAVDEDKDGRISEPELPTGTNWLRR